MNISFSNSPMYEFNFVIGKHCFRPHIENNCIMRLNLRFDYKTYNWETMYTLYIFKCTIVTFGWRAGVKITRQ